MDAADVQFDLQHFPQQDPVVAARAAAAREKEAAKEAKRNKSTSTKKKQTPREPTAREIKQVQQMAADEKERKTAREKAELVRRIRRYFKRFPKKLADVKLPRGFGPKTPYADVLDLHNEVELALHSGGNGAMLAEGVGFLLNGVENVAASRGYTKLAGPNASLSATYALQQESLMDTFDELAIKYQRYLASGPERRLATSLFMMTFMVVRANSAASNIEQHAEEELQPELQADFIAAMQSRPQ
jgi:hypothetical protein